MENEKKQIMTLENREQFFVGAVLDVESFSDEEVFLKTDFGRLHICGKGLHLENMSTSDGNVSLKGRIDKAEFFEIKEKRGFFRDIFR